MLPKEQRRLICMADKLKHLDEIRREQARLLADQEATPAPKKRPRATSAASSSTAPQPMGDAQH